MKVNSQDTAIPRIIWIKLEADVVVFPVEYWAYQPRKRYSLPSFPLVRPLKKIDLSIQY